MFQKFAGLAAAIAAIAAAAAICMVAISFAIYAALRDIIGPAWASAAVAGIIALLAVIIAFAATYKAKPKPSKEEPQSLVAKLIDVARERPLVAAAALAAGATVMVKNPRILSAILAAALAPKGPPPKR